MISAPVPSPLRLRQARPVATLIARGIDSSRGGGVNKLDPSDLIQQQYIMTNQFKNQNTSSCTSGDEEKRDSTKYLYNELLLILISIYDRLVYPVQLKFNY